MHGAAWCGSGNLVSWCERAKSFSLMRVYERADLEKVVNRPQAENSEFHYVLKILLFATKGESCVLNVGVVRWNF